MNRHQKKVLSLAAAIANLSLSCAVAGVATYAWFTTASVSHSTGISITTPDEFIKLNYIILKYNDDNKRGEAGGLNNPADFVLPEYDQYIKERNKYSNIIVRADLVFPSPIDTSEVEIKIDITKSESSTLKAADPTDGNKVKIRKLTSNVAQFKSIVTSYTLEDNTVVTVGDVNIGEEASTYQTDDDERYQTAINYFKTRKTPTTFISLMNGQPVDPLNGNVITLVPELYNVGTIKGAVVYLECSYNEQLVEGFVEDHPDESLANLVGDIERIDFGTHEFNDSTYGAIATGQYIRMNDAGSSYDGQYIDSYIASESQQILDGTKTTGAEDLEEVEGTGINTNNNQRSISNYISANQNNVYASKGIDRSSFEFNRASGTFKSDNGHYVGNPTNTDGIISRSDGSLLHNDVSYDPLVENSALVKTKVLNEPLARLQYDTSTSKFAYFSQTKNNINLYRYHENKPISASLTGFTLTAPNDLSYTLGEYFNLNGIKCIATYTRTGEGGDFTINVTNICTYTVDDIELVPEKTSFSFAGEKTVTVTYSDRGTEFTDSFAINIISDTITSMEITTQPAKRLYRTGESFNISDMVVTGTFAQAGTVVVLPSEYQCKVGNTYLGDGSSIPASVIGDNLEVVVEYSGGAARISGFISPSFRITVKPYVYTLTNVPETLELNGSQTITLDYNAKITLTITSDDDALSFSSSENVTTKTYDYSLSTYETLQETFVIYGRADGYATLTVAVTGKSAYKASFDITVGNPSLKIEFIAGTDKGANLTVAKDGFSITVSDGDLNRDDNYRCYANKTLTIASPNDKSMISIVFEGPGGQYSPSHFTVVGDNGDYTNLTWTGNSKSVQFTYTGQVRITKITIFYVQVQTFTVTINPGTGASGTPVEETVADGGSYVLQNYTYYNFTKPTGREFKWWEVGANHYNVGASLTITANTTVTAIWSDIFVVSFEAGSFGTGTMNPVSVGEGSTYSLPECTFTPQAGYTFDCWIVSGNEYDEGDEITINGNITVTAQWKVLHTVTFSGGGATGGSTPSEYVGHGDSLTLPSCGFTKDGYQFSGWQVGLETKQPGESVIINNDITITAQWSMLYTITFDKGLHGTGGSVAPISRVSGTTIQLPTCTFTHESGYVFDYWDIGGVHYAEGADYTITSSVTCTAVWKVGGTTTVTDTLTRTFTGVSGTSYTVWSGKTGTSGAVYAGKSAGPGSGTGGNSIQLRSNSSDSGIVTTTSGGKVKKITITWHSSTASGRTIDIYCSNTAYTQATDLYNNSTKGTLVGSIVYGTSTELTISGDYAYIGIRSNSGALYITSIGIEWAPA